MINEDEAMSRVRFYYFSMRFFLKKNVGILFLIWKRDQFICVAYKTSEQSI